MCRANSFSHQLLDRQRTGYGEKSLSELTPADWHVRLGRDHKIKEIVMAKVIEFYVPKNFRHRVLLADKEISLAATGFRTDSGEGK